MNRTQDAPTTASSLFEYPFASMNTRILPLLLGLLLLPGLVFAQQGTIQGTVTDAQTGNTLPGATVQIPSENMGSATDSQGQFSFRVDPGEYTVQVSFIGYQDASQTVNVSAGATRQVRIQLQSAQQQLDELVVTGVAAGTQKEKLGFSLSKVGTQELQEVPASDPANALRGKIAGAQVVAGSGNPASSPDIRLRGSTSITGDQQPLVIVDGIITSGGLNGISMQDVESIEVIKGAAASSLYGSLAGNGVIQIRTKDGSESGEFRVNVRTEYGASDIQGSYPTATRHPWQMNNIEVQLPNGDTRTVSGEEEARNVPSGSKIISWPGRSNENFASDGLYDNSFPVLYDNVENAVTSQAFNTNYISVGGSEEAFRYHISFENYNQGGVLEPVNDYNRNTFRVNTEYSPNDRLTVTANASYVDTQAPVIEEQGQGDTYFYSILTADPYMDVTEKNDQGDFAFQPTGYDVQQSNWSNPFYVAQNRQWNFDRERLFGGAKIDFNVTDQWSLHARQSIDRTDERREEYYPVGFQTPDDDPTLASGLDFRNDELERDLISEVWTQYDTEIDELGVRAVAKYLYEDRKFDEFSAEGNNYAAKGIRNIGALSPSSYDIGSELLQEKTENYFLSLDLDYQDTYIVNGLVRRDGSSLFGSEERWQTYFRGSFAYRLTQDFEIPNVSELKLRASYGTSGNRPPFEAQYETFTATASGLIPQSLGNAELRSSTIYEFETGFNANFLTRFQLDVTYAQQRTTDDYLEVPLPKASGFNTQWQNIGEIKSSSYEAALDGQILMGEGGGPTWNAGVTFSRVRQEITELGPRPPFTRNTVDNNGTAINLFRVEEDVPYGAMYGNELVTSLDELTTTSDGTVLNGGIDTNGDGQLTVDDYMVNDMGYVVPEGTHGTPQEQPVYMVNENGQTITTQIGNSQPSFQMGFRSNFSWKGFGVYALVDWSQGGEVYNYSKQLLYFNYRHEDQQEFAQEGYHYSYSGASSSLYNQGAASSHFVEDASYVKLREVSLSYTFDQSQLSTLFGDTVSQVKLGVVGRNLLTFTDYSGWDPEVGLQANSTNFRLDEYAYPNFRTFTGSLNIQF